VPNGRRTRAGGHSRVCDNAGQFRRQHSVAGAAALNVRSTEANDDCHHMHQLETQIEIEASAERVWSLLVDFPAHSRWNPFIRSIAGSPAKGQSLQVLIQPPGAKGMRFRPTVLAVEANRELRWKGKLFLPGLFDGEHYFQLESKAGGGIIFRQGEIFSGLLVPLFRGSLDGATRQGFVAMNEALKREAEKR